MIPPATVGTQYRSTVMDTAKTGRRFYPEMRRADAAGQTGSNSAAQPVAEPPTVSATPPAPSRSVNVVASAQQSPEHFYVSPTLMTDCLSSSLPANGNAPQPESGEKAGKDKDAASNDGADSDSKPPEGVGTVAYPDADGLAAFSRIVPADIKFRPGSRYKGQAKSMRPPTLPSSKTNGDNSTTLMNSFASSSGLGMKNASGDAAALAPGSPREMENAAC
ncbi:unnamed protein product [Amoebophrya sp. A120]|nr:unnamed protein product [Amoebophrya sp. A120]|eukprot:GSA120T00010762001.1